MTRSFMLLAGLVCLAGCAADGGPDTAAAESAPCEGTLGCLRLEEVLLVGDSDGPGMIEAEMGTARRDSRGRYYVYSEFGQQIKVFSPEGEYRRTMGRAGDGPGEFRGIATVHPGPGDSLHVVDRMAMRWSIYSPEHELVRSVPLAIPVYMQMKLLPGGRALFSAPVRGELRLLPFHLMDVDGTHIRSFGAASVGPPPHPTDADWRRMGSGGDTLVWGGYHDRYRLELWHAEGLEPQPRRVIEREVEWFPPGLPEVISVEEPPTPRLRAVRQDVEGRLLVLLHVADDRWHEAVVPGTVHATVSDRHRFWDTRLELLDAGTGELLASAEHDLAFHGLVADDLAIVSVTDELGAPRVAVWSISLQEEAGAER